LNTSLEKGRSQVAPQEEPQGEFSEEEFLEEEVVGVYVAT